MLKSLKIENIAVIEEAFIEFCEGLNVITGETGAGKSIIIDSLNAVLGERTSHDLIRTGSSSAKVTAEFIGMTSLGSVFNDLGIDWEEDGTVIIVRSLSQDGRNVCRVNGCPVNISTLKTIAPYLVNIHGQHDNQSLLSPEKHYSFIDAAASNDYKRTRYKDIYRRTVAIKKEMDALLAEEADKAARLELLNFQINEIEAAGIHPGERDELNARKALISNSGKALKALSETYAILRGGDDTPGVIDNVEKCLQLLGSVSGYLKEADEGCSSLRECCALLDDCAGSVSSAVDSFDFSPEALAEINERLDEIYRLSLKYGSTEEIILEAYSDMCAAREKIILSSERLTELERQFDEVSVKIREAADALSQSRKRAAATFEKCVRRELDFLDMPGVSFKVDISDAPLSSRGADRIEFLISPNPGQELRPLAKIASGGELSRIMLAIKSVISAKDDIPTLIFDEIDTGVSGKASQKIGMKLRDVADGRQVICVTHLAQIAARSRRHIMISKTTRNGETYTVVTPLDREGRVNELARINYGMNITDLQRKSAEELLESAENEREEEEI